MKQFLIETEENSKLKEGDDMNWKKIWTTTTR